MKKNILFLSCVLFLSGCGSWAVERQDQIDALGKEEVIRLGYCPTMQADATMLQAHNARIEIMEFASAGEVLDMLRYGQIDVALIGRKAKKVERTQDMSEYVIGNPGYTLIAPQKQTISHIELGNITVFSCLSPEVEESFPELHLTFRDCDYQNGKAWLISWEEFRDDFELLIPINAYGEKFRAFRSAFLYTGMEQYKLNLDYGNSY